MALIYPVPPISFFCRFIFHIHFAEHGESFESILTDLPRMNRRKADFKFAYKFLEDDV